MSAGHAPFQTSAHEPTSAARSHVGVVRTLNEDNFLDSPNRGIWAVADGMGGHEAGEVASSLLIENLTNLNLTGKMSEDAKAVRATVEEANAEFLVRAAALSPGKIIGSTLVVLLVTASRFMALWAGDSRVYLFRDNKLRQISHDHSVVQEMIDAKTLSRSEARGHSSSNIITRAVGVSTEFRLDEQSGERHANDLFLLCSDGLTACIDDNEIQSILATMPINLAADELLALALERQARDNVTVVLVRPAPAKKHETSIPLLRRLLGS
jgi:serine/threonine protein phosphatase PrpC